MVLFKSSEIKKPKFSHTFYMSILKNYLGQMKSWLSWLN